MFTDVSIKWNNQIFLQVYKLNSLGFRITSNSFKKSFLKLKTLIQKTQTSGVTYKNYGFISSLWTSALFQTSREQKEILN